MFTGLSFSGLMCMWYYSISYLFNAAEFDDYAEIVDDDPDYAHPVAGRFASLAVIISSVVKLLTGNTEKWK